MVAYQQLTLPLISKNAHWPQETAADRTRLPTLKCSIDYIRKISSLPNNPIFSHHDHDHNHNHHPHHHPLHTVPQRQCGNILPKFRHWNTAEVQFYNVFVRIKSLILRESGCIADCNWKYRVHHTKINTYVKYV